MATIQTGKATELITFSRASNATLVDSDGKVKWAPHNLLLSSEQFDSASWDKISATVAANSTAAPNGTTTADTFTETGSGSYLRQQATIVSGSTLTFSIFVKRGNFDWLRVSLGNDNAVTNGASVWFNINTGAKGSTATYGTGWSVVDYSISASTNGFFQVNCTVVAGSTTIVSYAVSASADSSVTLANVGSGAGVGTIRYLWGAHVYRSDLGGMQPNTSAYPMYNPTTPKNLLGYTEDFSNAAWTKSATTVSVNAVTAPNGLQTADALNDTAATAIHYVYQSVAAATVSGTNYTVRFYAKANTLNYVCAGITDISSGSLYASAVFNLSTGAVATSLAAGTGYAIVGTPSITSAGDGWYLCSVTCTVGLSKSFLTAFIGANKTGVITAGSGGMEVYLGNGSGIYLWGAQLSDSASLDPYVPVYGAAVTSAAYYGPRRDFDPVTLACKGLLVEEQRTNLVLYSAQFDVAPWGLTRATITANAIAAPDGATTADKLVETVDTGTHAVTAASATISLAAHTGSAYLKAAERTWAVIGIGASTTGLAYFDLGTGTVGTVTGGFTASIVAVGNGWYRCSLSGSIAASSSSPFAIYPATANNSVSYAGDITKGIYLWGAQLEAGSFPTSYIPTGAATATRNADVASVSTQAFPYSSTEGTWVANFQTVYSGTAAATVYLLNLDGSASKRVLYLGSGSDVMASYDGTTIVSSTGDVTGSISKSASAYSSTERAVVSNGGTVATGAIAAGYATASTAYLGSIGSLSGTGPLCGHIRQITYLPRRISNTELQTRTS